MSFIRMVSIEKFVKKRFRKVTRRNEDKKRFLQIIIISFLILSTKLGEQIRASVLRECGV